jgi:nucleotide-binding universal stress UspA family protein
MTEPDPGPGPVIVGFEDSTSGEDALALGKLCGRVLGVPVIVAVVHPSPAPISPARVDAEWIADRHREAVQVLDRARSLAADDDPSMEYRIVASSSAAHGLHDLAEELAAALIAVGSGRTAAQHRLLAGSTAERLLSGAVCPVAVAPADLRTRQPRELTRIGVGYVDTPEARAALDLAARLALRTSAELVLYSVVTFESDLPPIGGRDAERAFLGFAREEFQQALDRAIAPLPEGVRASGHVLTGNVVEVLADLDVDVLFCGSRGYGPVRRVLLGGVSSRLVRQATTPLVIVPRAG